MTLHAIGDSVTLGYPASYAECYSVLFAAYKGFALSNHAQGGRHIQDWLDAQAFPLGILAADRFVTQLSTNDTTDHVGASPAKVLIFKGATMSLLLHLGIPDEFKVKAQDIGDVEYVGSWANSSYYGSNWGRYSATNGDTATFSLSGDVIYVSYCVTNAVAGYKLAISVDGESRGQFNCYGGWGGYDVSYTQNVARLSGLGDGPHTVVITVVSGTEGRAEWEWAAAVPPRLSDRCHVYVGNQDYLPGAGAAECAAINTAIAEVIATLRGDGLRIYLADIYPVVAYPADYADDYHPNDSGHYHMSLVFDAIVEDPDSVDVDIDCDAYDLSAAFRSMDNVGTWGVNIGLTEIFTPEALDGNVVDWVMIPASGPPPAWNEVNWQLGSGFTTVQFVLRADWAVAVANLFDCAVSPADLADILIAPYFYMPTDGNSVNFYPQEYTPPAWNEVNWIWPEHCLIDAGSIGSLDETLYEIAFLTDQNLSMTLLEPVLAVLEMLVSIDVAPEVMLLAIDEALYDIIASASVNIALTLSALDVSPYDIVRVLSTCLLATRVYFYDTAAVAEMWPSEHRVFEHDNAVTVILSEGT